MYSARSRTTPSLPPLLSEAAQGNVRGVKLMLARLGGDINLMRDDNKNTALHLAAMGAHTAVVKLLVEHSDADVDRQNHDGNTPLHLAVMLGTSTALPTMEYLLGPGRADPLISNQAGKTPCDLARANADWWTDQRVQQLFFHHSPHEIGDKFLSSIQRQVSVEHGTGLVGGSAGRQIDANMQHRVAARFQLSKSDVHDYRVLYSRLLGKSAGAPSGLGNLQPSHLRPLFEFLGIETFTAELKELLNVMDANRDKYVDFEDFLCAMQSVDEDFLPGPDGQPIDTHAIFDAPFAAFDKDGDGIISADDYRQCMDQLGDSFFCKNDQEISTILSNLVRDYATKKKAGKEAAGIDKENFKRIVRGQVDMNSIEKAMRYHSLYK